MSRLKRILTLSDLVIFGIGVIVGAGIYSIIGLAAGIAGYGVWLSVLVAGVVTILTGLSFAEMAGIYPKTDSYYRLLKSAFYFLKGKVWGFCVEWLLILASIFAIATVSMAFAGYFTSLFQTNSLVVSVSLIALASIITFVGIKTSINTVKIFMLVEMAGLFIIILSGLVLAKPNLENFTNFTLDRNIFLAAALIFFAYTGFEFIPSEAEESKRPKKYVPEAIIIAIIVSMALYVLVALAVTNVMDPSELGKSNAPLVDVARNSVGGMAPLLLWVSAIAATSSTVLGMVVAASRLIYGLGREKLLPAVFGRVHRKFNTPHISISIVGALSILIVVLVRDLTTTAEIANLVTLVTFLLINSSVVILRFHRPNIPRSFKVPLAVKNIPLLSVFATVLCYFMIVQYPQQIIFYGLEFFAAGIIFYYAFKKHFIF